MRAVERASTAASGTPADRGPVAARRSARVRRDEQQAKNTRVGIILSLFLAFLAAALLIGGRAFIDPMLRAAAEARQTESTLDRCPEARPRLKGSVGSNKGFAWGAN